MSRGQRPTKPGKSLLNRQTQNISPLTNLIMIGLGPHIGWWVPLGSLWLDHPVTRSTYATPQPECLVENTRPISTKQNQREVARVNSLVVERGDNPASRRWVAVHMLSWCKLCLILIFCSCFYGSDRGTLGMVASPIDWHSSQVHAQLLTENKKEQHNI